MDNIINDIVIFYQNNTEVSIALVVAVVVLLFYKPKETVKGLGVIGVLFLIYLIVISLIDVTDKGADKKNEAGHRTEQKFQENDK